MTLIKNIFLSILSFFLIIFILEISLRLLGNQSRVNDLAREGDPVIYKNDEELGWVHKPGLYYFQPWSKDGKITKFSIIANGSRKISENDDSYQDYIFIGGSLTQGWAVDDSENFVNIFRSIWVKTNLNFTD